MLQYKYICLKKANYRVFLNIFYDFTLPGCKKINYNILYLRPKTQNGGVAQMVRAQDS